MNKYIIILFFLSLNTFLYPQQPQGQVMRGTVVDIESKMTITGATVQISGTNIGTITDTTGNFRLKNIQPGRYSIQASFVGYTPSTLSDILVSSGKEVIITIELKENITALSEVKVVASKGKATTQNEIATASVRTFSIDETERYAGSLGDPSRMAKNFAGVSTGDDGRNDIIIRGNSPTGLLWRLEGFDIPNPNHFGALGTTGGAVSMLNNNLLTNSDFFSGAFPAEYGNAMSGVFDLKMRNGNNENHEFVGQAGFNGFELGAEGPVSKKNKSSFLINYRYSMLSLLNVIGLHFGKEGSVPEYQDLSFKLNFPFPKGSVTVFGIGGLDRMNVKKETKRDTILNKMGVLGISYVHFIGKKTRIEAKTSGQFSQSINNEHRYNVSSQTFLPDYISDFKEPKLTFSIAEKTKLNSRNNIAFGINITRFYLNFVDSTYTSKLTGNGTPINYWEVLRNTKGRMNRYLSYGQWQHHFGDQLSITTGINYIYLDYNNSYNIEPRVGLNLNMTDNQKVSFGFGMHSQTQPTIVYLSEEYDNNGVAHMLNKNLGLSKSIHGVIGYDYNISKQLRLKSEIYYQHLYNIPISGSQPQQSLINSGADFEIVPPDSLQSSAKGKNYGIEITIEKFFENHYYFLITNSFFQSKYTDNNGFERNTAFNNNFIINGLFGYELPVGNQKQNSFSFNLRSTYAGGNPKLAIDLQQSVLLNKTILDWTNAYKERYPDYFRLDIRFGYKQNKKRFSQEFAIDIQNITNHQNILRESFDKLTKEIENDYQIGLFPMALYRINF
jgi:hypothetical protein